MRTLREHVIGVFGFGLGWIFGLAAMWAWLTISGSDLAIETSRPAHTIEDFGTWTACGPGPSYGCVVRRGQELRCTDGARLYEAWSECSPGAAAQNAIANEIQPGGGDTGRPRIISTRSVRTGTVVRFGQLVAAPGRIAPDCRWMYVWPSMGGYRMLYAPDYEHLRQRLHWYGIELDAPLGGGA
jgi:hypothetical protein